MYVFHVIPKNVSTKSKLSEKSVNIKLRDGLIEK